MLRPNTKKEDIVAGDKVAKDDKPYCTRCRGEIHPEALACPHCGSVFTNTEAYEKEKEAESNASCFALVVGAAIVIFSVIWVLI